METPRLDAELLVAHGLGLSRLDLYLAFERPVSETERATIRALLQERGRHVPVAYLLGEREFWSLAFAVGPGVLVPRPETEHVVEAAIEAIRPAAAPVFVDVGTGSGCIAISLLTERPEARGHAVDRAPAALKAARENAERHDVSARLAIHEGDLLAPLRGTPDWGKLDLVVSNPPYVLLSDPLVEKGVRAHEPPEAIFVEGDDPLSVARRIAEDARPALRPGGALILEVGHESASDAAAMLEDLGYEEIHVAKDLAKIDRVVSGIRPVGIDDGPR